MFRKVVIVVLTLGAAGTIAIWIGTYQYYSLYWQSKQNGQLPSLIVGCQGGRCSFNWWSDAHDVKIRRGQGGSGLSYGEFAILTVYHQRAGFPAFPAGFTISHAYDFKLDPSQIVQVSNVKRTCVLFPFWFAFAALAAYPTIAFIRGPLRRHRRRKKGLCVICGYDLTGNTSGICPECGAKVLT